MPFNPMPEFFGNSLSAIKIASKFLKHIPCEACGSSDGNSLYDDGHTYCHVCNNYESNASYVSDGSYEQVQYKSKVKPMISNKNGEIKAIPDRGITQQTCEAYGVRQDAAKHYYPYFDQDGKEVAAKVRHVELKNFNVEGSWSQAVLFGQQLFQ